MPTIITKELAQKIADKLQAVLHPKTNRPHDLFVVYHEGQLITQFGIRRGSRKDEGHDHVPSAIRLSPNKARLLGQCPMLREDWVAEMIEKGVILPRE
ncbi:MAG TPA: hypothetical protein VMY42_27050 [Thermoguttaceae bacterium]|nr:hypothetical protein [Thermoguttaceae bacterium]